MKNMTIIWFFLFSMFLFSCSRAVSNETVAIEETKGEFVTSPTDLPQPQIQGVPSFNVNNEFNFENIESDFIGVFLPVEYINSLEYTRSHSLSMHLNNGRYHDVLAVVETGIYSNAKFHDQYAIKTSEINLFQFVRNDGETIIIDNNGYSYIKIGNDPNSYHNIVRTFISEIVLSEILRRTELSLTNGIIIFPFPYSIEGENAFIVQLSDMFFEKGFNLLLANINLDRFVLGLIIEDDNYLFYNFVEDEIYYIRSEIVFSFNLKQDL